MPQVSVTINGRQFRMACESGEEARLMRLAGDLDARIVALRGRFGEIGDTRLTVMAALALADELSERSEEHTSELQSLRHLVCRLLLEKKKTAQKKHQHSAQHRAVSHKGPAAARRIPALSAPQRRPRPPPPRPAHPPPHARRLATQVER